MNFTQRYDTTIERLDNDLSEMIDSGSDFELEKNGDVLSVMFEDGSKFIISPNSPVSQLWVSANYEGHRFNFDEAKESWIDEKTGEEFMTYIMRLISAKLA
jgi:CyaY protein